MESKENGRLYFQKGSYYNFRTEAAEFRLMSLKKANNDSLRLFVS